MFYSQQNEDKILYEKYLNYENGFFIELGAMDGITFSNTFFFEKNLNWTGILIEPTHQFDKLIKNRPNCKNYNYAISNYEGELEFLGNYALGGLTKNMHEKHRLGWNLDECWKPSFVNSIPLNKLIPDYIKKVDFLSIDVEGSEYEVLSTYNWNIETYIILIEMGYDEFINNKCRELLTEKKFIFDMIIGNNEVYIKKL